MIKYVLKSKHWVRISKTIMLNRELKKIPIWKFWTVFLDILRFIAQKLSKVKIRFMFNYRKRKYYDFSSDYRLLMYCVVIIRVKTEE